MNPYLRSILTLLAGFALLYGVWWGFGRDRGPGAVAPGGHVELSGYGEKTPTGIGGGDDGIARRAFDEYVGADARTLLATDGRASGGAAELPFEVPAGAKRLAVSAEADSGLEAALVDPAGAERRTTEPFFRVEAPAAGTWKLRVRVSPSARLSVRARAR